jgi:hypothetical protein
MGLFLCLAAFVACFLLGRRSQLAGVGGVLVVGYLYGVVRANFLDTYAHFIFDSAVVGFYLAVMPDLVRFALGPAGQLGQWVGLLLGWVLLMFIVPIQHPLIQLVGLRGNAFLVPFLLVGGRLTIKHMPPFTLLLAALNGMAFAFAISEYVLGVPAFFPRNPVTELIYRSNDVAGYTALRIPACFVTAHAHAGTMVATFPWLMGEVVQPRMRWERRVVLLGGIAAAVLGVLLTATRVGVVLLAVLILVSTLSGKVRGGQFVVWAVLLGAIGYVVSGEARMQRFLTLQDTEQVIVRVEGSVNASFLDLLANYPMGNGLGGGGTSIPYFLQSLINNPIGMENEYSRLLLEQGFPGLALWVVFAVWLLARHDPLSGSPWELGRRLLWWSCLGNLLLAMLGTGLMTSIPQTVLFFLAVGFLGRPPLGRPLHAPQPRPPAGDHRSQEADPHDLVTLS